MCLFIKDLLGTLQILIMDYVFLSTWEVHVSGWVQIYSDKFVIIEGTRSAWHHQKCLKVKVSSGILTWCFLSQLYP